MSSRLINRGERLSTIERMLFRNSEGLRAVEIAQACGVDRRTVYRDLAMLEKQGVPIAQDEGRFFINRDYYLATMRLNFNEAVALFVAARVLSRNAEQQNPHLISALTKLSVTLPDPLSSHVTYIADWVRSNPVNPTFVQTLETMTRGWVERRSVKIWSSVVRNGEVQARDFSTYFIEPTTTGGLYAIGFDDLTQRVKTIKLEWIRRAKLSETTYEIPAQFDRRPYLESVWGIVGQDEKKTRVVLAFPADVTPLVRERLWHASQQIEILEDKRCTLNVDVADPRDLLPWIRSWGVQMEVLEPEWLRSELATEAVRVAEIYRGAQV
ncbi:MAG: WYL domain-containing protein [Anaerolineae bacterium]|nr:WYL domain-containing protein [Anaerolineae bacterium]